MAVRTVTRRGSSRLVIDLFFTKQDGTRARYRHDAQVQTKSGALAEERRLLANIAKFGDTHEPKPITPDSFTFRDAVELFEKTTAVTSLKPRTWMGYRHILDKRLIPRFADRQLHTIGFSDGSQLDAQLVSEGLSAGTRRNMMVCLRSILSTSVEQGKLAGMPKLPTLPRLERTVLRTLTQEQVDKLLSGASSTALVIMGLAAYAGLRAGEVRALRWKDVDLVKGVLVVRTAICRGVEATPKSGDQREVPIARPLHQILESIKRNHTHVAVTRQGKVWGEQGPIQVVRRASVRAGIGGWRFHDLRHYFVTHLFSAGVPAHVVQALAGHGSLEVTQRYAHTTHTDLTNAIRKAWKVDE